MARKTKQDVRRAVHKRIRNKIAGTDGRRDDRHDAAEGTEAPSRSKSTHEFLFLLSVEDVLETAQPPTYVRR